MMRPRADDVGHVRSREAVALDMAMRTLRLISRTPRLPDGVTHSELALDALANGLIRRLR